MAAKVNIYWPRAEVRGDDGGTVELKTDEGYKALMFAVKKVLEWKKEYGGRYVDGNIDVRGEKGRLKYTVHVDSGIK